MVENWDQLEVNNLTVKCSSDLEGWVCIYVYMVHGYLTIYCNLWCTGIQVVYNAQNYCMLLPECLCVP